MHHSLEQQARNYAIVAEAIRFIRENSLQQPSLTEIAQHVGMSESHCHRIFSEWAGVSPKRFLQFMTRQHAREILRQSRDLLTTSMDVGLSSPGRLHDLFITWEAMTPGEVKHFGKDTIIRFGICATPFGNALFAWTDRGLTNLAFCDDQGNEEIAGLQQQWPHASFIEDRQKACLYSRQIFDASQQSQRLHLLLRGSPFQIKVWEALLKIGSGQLVSYGTVAELCNTPRAHRAVGTANAANRIAYLIPCHRVIRESGESGIYHWGGERKKIIHGWEVSRNSQ